MAHLLTSFSQHGIEIRIGHSSRLQGNQPNAGKNFGRKESGNRALLLDRQCERTRCLRLSLKRYVLGYRSGDVLDLLRRDSWGHRRQFPNKELRPFTVLSDSRLPAHHAAAVTAGGSARRQSVAAPYRNPLHAPSASGHPAHEKEIR